MFIWWNDSEVKVIDGRRFMYVYEFGKYPRYYEGLPTGVNGTMRWYRVSADEVNDAIGREMEGDEELNRHYEMMREW